MAAYSLDLRQRVVRACASGLRVTQVAKTFEVSRAWAYQLVKRQRETGSIAPRPQTKFRGRALSETEEERLVALITAQPDATLAELQRALPTAAALSTLWRVLDRRGITVKKWACLVETPTRVMKVVRSGASRPGQGRRLLVPRARKKMDPSTAPGAPRIVATLSV